MSLIVIFFVFFFNDTATTEIYTLSLHDALPIYQSDLVARLVLENVLVFGDGLGDFALVQQLLCGFDVFAFVISHSQKETNLPGSSPKHTLPAGRRAEKAPRRYSGNASRRKKGKSTNRKFVVSRQLSPCYLGNSRANTKRIRGARERRDSRLGRGRQREGAGLP